MDQSFAEGACVRCIEGVGSEYAEGYCDRCNQAFPQNPSPEKYTGQYECQQYGKNMNSWHYVTISYEGDNEYVWTNTANVSWSLF